MLTNSPQVLLALEPIDMRKSYQGLAVLAQQVLQDDPFSGHLFVFTNKKRNRLKLLYWHINGFCIWQKRLEKGCFHLPKGPKPSIDITSYQLQGLIQGIDWGQIPSPKALTYCHL